MTSLSLIYVSLTLFALLGLSSCGFLFTEQQAAEQPKNSSSVQQQQPAQIGVYFESRCPDSRRFFVSQLVPAYRKLGPLIQATLIPFGHARTLGQNKMICQHGPRECEGNRLMACIISRNASDNATIETLGCLFANELTSRQCVEQNLPGVSFDELETCKSADESYQLMVKYEEMTGRLDYVPHLTYNKQSSEEIQNECENNLKNYVCKNLDGKKPDACT